MASELAPLWAIRVELFVATEAASSRLLSPAHVALAELVNEIDRAQARGADQGTGMASPVIGLVLILPASSAGKAIDRAIDLTDRALGGESRGLYGATVVGSQHPRLDGPYLFPPLTD
jgi:hypothetical protein